MNFTAQRFSDQNTPKCDLSGPVLRRDIQRKSPQKVIDSSDFLLFPPVTQERSREGRGVRTEDNFRSEKYSLCGQKELNGNTRHGHGDKYLRVRQSSPSLPGPFLPSLAALRLSSSLSLQPFSHSGGGAVLPEKVRTQISHHFLSSAHTYWCCVQVLPTRSDIWRH